MSAADRVALRAKEEEVLNLKFRVIELRAALEGMMAAYVKAVQIPPHRTPEACEAAQEAIDSVADVAVP